MTSRRLRHLALMMMLALPAALAAQRGANGDSAYLAFAVSSGADQVVLLRIAPPAITVLHQTTFRDPYTSLGVHALTLSHDRAHYDLVGTAGVPNGTLLDVAIARDSSPYGDHHPSDTLRAAEPVGPRPDAVTLRDKDDVAWVTNGGDSADGGGTVSAVYLRRMTEAARIRVCNGVAGGTLAGAPPKYYVVCPVSNELAEIETHDLAVVRRIALSPPGAPDCGPMAVSPAADSTHLLVGCARSGEVLDIDATSGAVDRRFPVGGPLTAFAATRDGRTILAAGSAGIIITAIDAATGMVRWRIPIPRRMPAVDIVPASQIFPAMAYLAAAAYFPRTVTRIAVPPDDRYALITVGAGPSQSGTIEVLDLGSGGFVATAPLAPVPTDVVFWKMQRR